MVIQPTRKAVAMLHVALLLPAMQLLHTLSVYCTYQHHQLKVVGSAPESRVLGKSSLLPPYEVHTQ